MELLKNFLNSKSSADKRKYIVYAIASIICTLLIVIVIILNSKNEDEKVSDFSNPDAKEVKKFNSRAEANKMGKIDSSSLNIAMNDIFGEQEETNNLQNENVDTYEVPTYTNTSNQNNYTPPSYSEPTKNYNSHSTYGDYSMWQTEEPNNSNVGYSSKQPIKNKKKSSDNSKIDNSQNYTPPTYSEPSYSEPINNKVDFSEQVQIPAQLISQGTFQDGRALSFAIKEEITIKGNKLPKNFIIKGVGRFQNNRIMVSFNAIKFKNKLIPINVTLLDSNGIEGMGISGNDNNSDSDIENRIGNEVVRRTGVIGSVVSSVIKNKPTERTIALRGKQVYLVIN